MEESKWVRESLKEMLKRSEVGKRFCWTIFFVFIYVLGSKISLPFVDLSKGLRLNEGTTTGLQLWSAVMGGNLRGMSIFSIGLSPWMSSMILWRMFTVSNRFNLEKTSLLFSLALRSKCRFGAWKFCCDHDGWDGYVSARRRDADPFKCQ